MSLHYNMKCAALGLLFSFSVIAPSCSQPVPTQEVIETEERYEPEERPQWRFPVSELKRIQPSESIGQERLCEQLQAAIKETKIHDASREMFPGIDYVSSVDGEYYHINYKGEGFTVYKEIEVFFDRNLFPHDPYKDDAGDSRFYPLTIIPGKEHRTPSGFQQIVFGNSLARNFYYRAPTAIEDPVRKTSEISRANSELLSLVFHTSSWSFNGPAILEPDEEKEFRRFKSELGIDLDAEDWFSRYKIEPRNMQGLATFALDELNLAAKSDKLFVYLNDPNSILSYAFHEQDFEFFACKT